ncbi:MAG: hypothetical protein LBR53_09435 [Deltaproteobacteria bacterium]|jgi:hypothetical protein|nr:hypothetical protein [Deltaproteobacteria bacterium]
MPDKKQILEYFHLIDAELKKRNQTGEILIAGGARLCLVHHAGDFTKDIDGLYEPKHIINDIVNMIIPDNEDYPPKWLNDSIKSYIGANAPREEFLSLNNLKIYTASAEYLLAMKMISARFDTLDDCDLKYLMKKLNIATEEQAFDILLQFFSESQIQPKTMYAVRNVIEMINEEKEEISNSETDDTSAGNRPKP